MDLTTLLDEREIQATLLRYCRGIDRCDPDLLLSAYHPGARDDHGRFKGTIEDFVVWVIPFLKQEFVATQHRVSNLSISITGARADVESYVTAIHVLPAPTAVHQLKIFGGRYADIFEKRDGNWKIARRTVVHDWDLMVTSEAAYPAIEDAVNGLRDRSDVSYLLAQERLPSEAV